MLSGEAENKNFIVFGLTLPEFKTTIYRIRGDDSDHYTSVP